jgi:hypothetical protein
VAQVREWNAREDGPVAGRAKSLKRSNPKEQRFARGVKTAGDCRILRGSKTQKPNRVCRAANLSSGGAFENGKWAMAAGELKSLPTCSTALVLDATASQDQVRGKSFKGRTPRADARAIGRRTRVHQPSRTSKRRRRPVLAGMPRQRARARKRCRGAKPHESRGGSQGLPQSSRVILRRKTEVSER